MGGGAADFAQETELFSRLHALGDHLGPQIARQRKDGAHQLRLLASRRAAGEQGAVDLQAIELGSQQRVERARAGAEIVHRQPQSAVAELGHPPGVLAVLQRVLGQLQDQVLRLEAVLRQDAFDVLEQVAVLQLPGGQVHAERQPLRRGAAPALEFTAGLTQEPATDRHHQSGLFGEGDEVLRRDQPPGGMGPANQGFETLDAAGGHVDDGKIVHAELLAHQSIAQLAFQLEQVRRALAQGNVEHHRARPALRLGAVHRGVRVQQQVLHPGMGGRAESDADAHRGADLGARDFERLAGDVVDVPGHDLGVGGFLDVIEEDAEIVSALARERIAFAQAGLDALAHLDQQLVARRVAEPFGHRLEPVHVQEEDRQAIAFAAPGARERAPRQVQEVRAIG